MSVKVYSTTTCPYCAMEKMYLKEKKITFEDILVDRDQAQAMEMVKKTGQMGVPVTVVKKDNKEEIVVGFDVPRLNKVLGL